MMRKANGPVYVKLTRPEGYEDACEQIVIEDAEIHPAFLAEPATEEIERLQAENERLRARGIEDMQFEIRQLRAAIAWALGYSSFRPREDGEGAYWWRKELRERSGLTSEQLERALPTKDSA